MPGGGNESAPSDMAQPATSHQAGEQPVERAQARHETRHLAGVRQVLARLFTRKASHGWRPQFRATGGRPGVVTRTLSK
jgi:hypothetical protein